MKISRWTAPWIEFTSPRDRRLPTAVFSRALVACGIGIVLGAATSCRSTSEPEPDLTGAMLGAAERERAADLDAPSSPDEPRPPIVAIESDGIGGDGAGDQEAAEAFLRETKRDAASEEDAIRRELERMQSQLARAGTPDEVEHADAPGSDGAADSPPTPAADATLNLDDADRLLAKAGGIEGLPAGDAAEPKAPEPVPPEVPAPPSNDPPPTLRSGSAEGEAAPNGAASAPPPPPPAEGAAPPAESTGEEQPARPQGYMDIVQLHQKTADEVLRFFAESFPDWIEKRYVEKVPGKARSVLVFGEKPDDPTTKQILEMIDKFDFLEVKPTEMVIRPRYIEPKAAMEAITMRGLAHVWLVTKETKTATWAVGKTSVSATHEHNVYAPKDLAATSEPPIEPRPKIPYVYELPEPPSFTVPKEYSGRSAGDRTLVDFTNMSSTEQRGAFVAVGTEEDIAAIEAFVAEIDQPARLIMIEVQVVELDANKFLDLGIDSVGFGQGHTLGSISLPLPGEPIVQPGLGDTVRRSADIFVPPITQEGFGLIFDDTSIDLSGRFLGNIHALVREGDATVKARPKILTLDGRTSVLHIGQEVPTFRSTGVTRDSTEGNLISEINEVAKEYVGFTLNIRPRVTGGSTEEVALQLEVIANQLGERQRVFEQDLLGIPTINRKHYIGETRVKNHRPIVLGGLIQETEVESVNKIPLLGDIPLLGYLFRRTQKSRARNEVIFVVTPHVLSQKGVDRAATPKESPIFDTFDSALFNDKHIIKGRDVLGIDPITGNPAEVEGRPFTEKDVVDLTLLNIIKQRELVKKLGILDDYLGDSTTELSWVQRTWPERTVKWWSERDQEVYFRAAAIVLENVKELNPDLDYDELVLPRREIVLPTTPFRISLSYDRVKSLQNLSKPILRGQRVELSESTLILLREAGGKSLRDFADFLAARERAAEDHAELIVELNRLYHSLYPASDALGALAYPDVFRELSAQNLDFMSLATYFQENLDGRYRTLGRPDIGVFDEDVRLFLESSLSLFKRAKRLRELEVKWSRIGEAPSEETTEGDA